MNAVGSYPTFSPLPQPDRFRLRRFVFCGAHIGLLRLGVTQHPALWSPDFPLTGEPHARQAATCSTPYPGEMIRGDRPGSKERNEKWNAGSEPSIDQDVLT